MSALRRCKLFAGIALDKRTRETCARIAARLERRGLAARYENAEKYHITLAFLGWVEPEAVDPVTRALHESATDCAPFSLALDRIGAFPHERKPRIVWIGSHEQGAAFRTAAETLRDAYRKMGFTFEKAAVAHVTIARVKGAAGPLPQLDVIEPMPVRAEAFTLFESLPDGRTTRYEVLSEAPLTGIRA